MSKVEGLSLGDEGLNVLPGLGLSSVGQEVHDDATPVDSLFDREQGLAWDPSVLNGLSPRLAVLSDTDNDLETIVTGVEGLTVSLGTVTNHGKGVILKVLGELLSGPVGSLVDSLGGTGKVKRLDTSSGLEPKAVYELDGRSWDGDALESDKLTAIAVLGTLGLAEETAALAARV